jgi:hypothetical protein
MTSNRPPASFVGEHLALDFLNTTATPRGVGIEWLGRGKDLVDWLEQAGAIEAAAAARIRESGGGRFDDVARQAGLVPIVGACQAFCVVPAATIAERPSPA